MDPSKQIEVDSNAPNWEPFYGNNHLILSHRRINGGGVSFKQHLGYPLNPRLWQDLVGRLGIRGLRIYRQPAEQWCDVPTGAVIHLDAQGNVSDITFYPGRF